MWSLFSFLISCGLFWQFSHSCSLLFILDIYWTSAVCTRHWYALWTPNLWRVSNIISFFLFLIIIKFNNKVPLIITVVKFSWLLSFYKICLNRLCRVHFYFKEWCLKSYSSTFYFLFFLIILKKAIFSN